MKIYLARHGEAVNPDVDPERPLGPHGRAQVERVARFLGEKSFPLSAIYHSTKARAKQTAQILQEHIAPNISLTEHPNMGPNDSIDDLLHYLKADEQDTLIVGHLPFLSKLCSTLLGRDELPILAFELAAVAALEKTHASWLITWVVNPSLIP